MSEQTLSKEKTSSKPKSKLDLGKAYLHALLTMEVPKYDPPEPESPESEPEPHKARTIRDTIEDIKTAFGEGDEEGTAPGRPPRQ